VRPRFGRVGDVALVTITDDSMYPRLEQGALLIINTALTPRSQDNVFCSLPNGARAVRIYRADNDGRQVEPINQTWGRSVKLDEGVEILGVVVGFWFETPAGKRLARR
jgi:phage repressor protein C with HTH and peptisase S24 domain